MQNIAQTKELDEVKTKLNNFSEALQSSNYRLKLTTQERDEHKYLVERHMNTEKSLLDQAQTLLNVADTAITDSYKLHDKIDRKRFVYIYSFFDYANANFMILECIKNLLVGIIFYILHVIVQ